MNILCIGDVIAQSGVEMVEAHLKSLKAEFEIDFTIANGENCTTGNGINAERADRLIEAGVDVITMGNHTFSKKEIIKLFEQGYPIIRPANMHPSVPGAGYIVKEVKGVNIAVISLLGRVNLEPADCPFRTADDVLGKLPSGSVMVVDFHAEATSEKYALAWYLDGKVSAMFGTHTHVQTADERVFPGGMGYITDLGMTGPYNSVIGLDKNIAVRRFLTQLPERFEWAEGLTCLNAIIFSIDPNTQKTVKVNRIFIK